jgi:hypothetical protein
VPFGAWAIEVCVIGTDYRETTTNCRHTVFQIAPQDREPPELHRDAILDATYRQFDGTRAYYRDSRHYFQENIHPGGILAIDELGTLFNKNIVMANIALDAKSTDWESIKLALQLQAAAQTLASVAYREITAIGGPQEFLEEGQDIYQQREVKLAKAVQNAFEELNVKIGEGYNKSCRQEFRDHLETIKGKTDDEEYKIVKSILDSY